MQPSDGLHGVVLRTCHVLGLRIKSLGNGTAQQDGVAVWLHIWGTIDIRSAEDFADTAQDFIRAIGLHHNAASAFFFVRAMVADPLLAEDFQTELAPLEVARFGTAGKGVRGGAETDDRLARIQELGEVRQTRVRKLAEARADDEQIRICEHLRTTDVLLIVRVDVARLFVRGEKHDAIEAVLLGQNLRQHRHALFCAVFLVTGHEDDLFATTGTTRIGGDFEVILRVRGCDRAKEGEGE